MNARYSLASAVITLVVAASVSSASVREFAYVSPLPGSRMVSPENNVVLRLGVALDAASVSQGLVSVTGTRSGSHTGHVRLSGDQATLVFRPDQPFATGETVHVRLLSGLRTQGGGAAPALDYTFQTSSVHAREMPRTEPERSPEPPAASAWWNEPVAPTTAATPCDTLLPGFPVFTLSNTSNQLPGAFFMAPFGNANTTLARLQILDDRGKPIFQRQYDGSFRPTDFKVQPNGLLSFFLSGNEQFYLMDSSYTVVDSIACGNGYPTDLHELQILPDHHALLMSYDPQPVDMSTIVSGGNPNAIVTGLIIQELDENKDVVFQWRSWDHFLITDCSPNNINLTAAFIDYCHGNSIEETPDGNIMISSRHMNEITKIDRATGNILWRMGRNAVHNQFSFPNDTRGWAEQHDARILPNGHLTLFDNANGLVPAYSRALEFQLDEANLVATKVWEYRNTPDVVSGFMGNVQRHADGSTTIGWGGTAGTIKTTDLHADGTIAAQVNGPGSEVNYRGFRMPWRMNRFVTSTEDMTLASPAVTEGVTQTVAVTNHWNQAIDLTCLSTSNPAFSAVLASGSLPVHLGPGEATDVQVTYTPTANPPVDARLYVMQVQAKELVAQTVELHGHVDGLLDAPPAAASAFTATARPNPLRLNTTIDFTVPSAGRVSLALFDIHGRKVATLVDGPLSAGRHSVAWSAPRGRGGLYFYRLQAGDRTLVEKLVVTGE
jgi:hypothetical protein